MDHTIDIPTNETELTRAVKLTMSKFEKIYYADMSYVPNHHIVAWEHFIDNLNQIGDFLKLHNGISNIFFDTSNFARKDGDGTDSLYDCKRRLKPYDGVIHVKMGSRLQNQIDIRLPIMAGSRFCKPSDLEAMRQLEDPGGYMVEASSGMERVILMYDNIMYNIIRTYYHPTSAHDVNSNMMGCRDQRLYSPNSTFLSTFMAGTRAQGVHRHAIEVTEPFLRPSIKPKRIVVYIKKSKSKQKDKDFDINFAVPIEFILRIFEVDYATFIENVVNARIDKAAMVDMRQYARTVVSDYSVLKISDMVKFFTDYLINNRTSFIDERGRQLEVPTGLSYEEHLKWIKHKICEYLYVQVAPRTDGTFDEGVKIACLTYHARHVLYSKYFLENRELKVGDSRQAMFDDIKRNAAAIYIANSDRDSLRSKRVRNPGGSLFDIMKDSMRSSFSTRIKKLGAGANLDNVAEDSKSISNEISKKINGSITKGHLKKSKLDVEEKIVINPLQKESILDMINHMRRIVTLGKENNKEYSIREIHPTHFGFICPVDSPEGAHVGFTRNLSSTAHVSLRTEAELVARILRIAPNFAPIKPNSRFGDSIVINMNGVVEFIVAEKSTAAIEKALELLRNLKRKFLRQISVSYSPLEQTIYIFTEEDRLIRPVLITDNLIGATDDNVADMIANIYSDVMYSATPRELAAANPGIGVAGLMAKVREAQVAAPRFSMMPPSEILAEISKPFRPLLEFIDVYEAEMTTCAVTYHDIVVDKKSLDYTYYTELEPTAALGVLAQNLIMYNHNIAPRNIFGLAQSKQASCNIKFRRPNPFSTMLSAPSPNLPYCTTRRQRQLLYPNFLKSFNIMFSVASCPGKGAGYNTEDAAIINGSSNDCGSTFTLKYKNYKHVARRTGQESEVFGNLVSKAPDKVPRDDHPLYKNVDENGCPKLGKYFDHEDVAIGVYTMQPNGIPINSSKTIKLGDEGRIIDVEYASNFVSAEIEMNRPIQIGDKWATNTDQKSTTGFVARWSQLPITADGTVPDIMYGPYGMFSRITLAFPHEVIFSLYAVLKGVYIDATAFVKRDLNKAIEYISKHGGQSIVDRREVYHPDTGQLVKFRLLMAPCSIQKLKHNVKEKFFARADGPMSVMFQQPPAGKAQEGGLRFGYMEYYGLLSGGVSLFLNSKMTTDSDGRKFLADKNRGVITAHNRREGVNKAGASVSLLMNQVRQVGLPYSSMQFINIAKACGIDIRLGFGGAK